MLDLQLANETRFGWLPIRAAKFKADVVLEPLLTYACAKNWFLSRATS
jgi:hypothetical protein